MRTAKILQVQPLTDCHPQETSERQGYACCSGWFLKQRSSHSNEPFVASNNFAGPRGTHGRPRTSSPATCRVETHKYPHYHYLFGFIRQSPGQSAFGCNAFIAARERMDAA
ncbi:hypothetical protein J6590_039173 [Homalodisca vitripennis]|nr:hypothetical protein J6590_039173 [Homalodisca vitripennis]